MHLLSLLFMFILSISMAAFCADENNHNGYPIVWNGKNIMAAFFLLLAAVLFVSACFVTIF